MPQQRHNLYCSNDCANKAKIENKINKWLNNEYTGIVGKDQISDTIRDYLLKKSNYKCQLCNWGSINKYTNKVPLEIHHLDGNCLNNKLKIYRFYAQIVIH